MKRDEKIRIFSEELWNWFDDNKRTLPWRDLAIKDDNQRAYLVLVSEVMLQQTQVSRVVELYKKFVRTFPDLESLSKASNAEVIRAWQGMGYNARALRLRDAARTIQEKHRGVFPHTKAELTEINGIGDYTAGAILNFAFDCPTPCIDVNIRRILHRFFYGPENEDGSWRIGDGQLLLILEDLVRESLSDRRRTPKDFFAALMDFGSMVCTKHRPKWDQFSPGMKSICKAYGKEVIRTKKVNKREPGRVISGRFVPERITRGKIIEFLRAHPEGKTRAAIGKAVAEDWSRKKDGWLLSVLTKLERDQLLQRKEGRYCL